jgi:hypothetical protein
MEREIADSLEELANLVYLIRTTLDDPEVAIKFADLATERIRDLALHLGIYVPRSNLVVVPQVVDALPLPADPSLEFECLFCGAQLGEPCEMNNGAARFESHRER